MTDEPETEGNAMKVQETVRRETINIAVGTAVLTGVMLAVFALLGRMNVPVILGAVLGCCVAVLDFFLLGLTVQSAAELQATLPAAPAQTDEDGEQPESQEQQEVSKQIRRKMQLSQMGRMLMMVAAAVLGAAAPCFDLFAVVIPFLFPKTVIYARTLLQKK